MKTLLTLWFEYGAILKGSQTHFVTITTDARFEYGAILKGSQTHRNVPPFSIVFEYGAILKGSQTDVDCFVNC